MKKNFPLLSLLIFCFANCIPQKVNSQHRIFAMFEKNIQTTQDKNPFEGFFEGHYNNKVITASLSTSTNILKGIFSMNGEEAHILGTIKNNSASGKITETLSAKTYAFTARRNLNDLYLSITFPEYQHQTVTMTLKRKDITETKVKDKSRDSRLFGKWRNTEIISSGSGQFYSSISTDYFVNFNADGTVFIWTGKSAGGTKDIGIENNTNSKVPKMEWFTSEKILYLVNPENKQKTAIQYYAEPRRMMLTSGKSKKVYQRVN